MKKGRKFKLFSIIGLASASVITLASCDLNFRIDDVIQKVQKAFIRINNIENGSMVLMSEGANLLPIQENYYEVNLGKTVDFVPVCNENYTLSSLTLNEVDILESKAYTFNLSTLYYLDATFSLIQEDDSQNNSSDNDLDGDNDSNTDNDNNSGNNSGNTGGSSSDEDNKEDETPVIKYGTIQIDSSITNGTVSFANYSNNSQVQLSTTVKVNAKANSGYYLDKLTVNGISIKTSKSFIVSEEKTYVVSAEFKESTATGKYCYLYGNETIKPSRGSQSADIDEYYEPVRGLYGEELKDALHEIIDDHTTYSYDSLNSSMMVTDVDPNNSGRYIRTYEGSVSKGSSFNKEHTWAKSHGNFGTSRPAGSDMHHLRPCFSNLNSCRSNYDFGTVATHSSSNDWSDKSWWTDEMDGNYCGTGLNTSARVFEPKDEFKGDVARMIFYMAVRYDGSSGEKNLEVGGSRDTSRFYTYNYSSATGQHGNFVDLYEWATSSIDPVSDFEVNRNNIIDEEYQHNRNPFIDHPEFIEMIYDKTYSGPGALNDL